MKVAERKCAICGMSQRHAPQRGGIAAFTLPLKWLGFEGNYAHPFCLWKAQAKKHGLSRGGK